jgi:hypothetical protein
MTVNTQFPIAKEYVRAFPHDDGEKVLNVIIYPMLCFRVPQEALQSVIKQTVAEANKRFDDTRPEYMRSLVNHSVNKAFARLNAEGVLVEADDDQKLSSSEYLQVLDNSAMVGTCDGYIVFNPASMPPTPSEHLH